MRQQGGHFVVKRPFINSDMTSDQTPNSDPKPNPQGSPPEPKTVEAKVVESSSETPKKTPTKPAPSSDDSMDKVKAVAAELWRQAKPVLQTVGTQALLLGNRGADFLLDKAFPTAKDKFLQVLPADLKAQAQEKIEPVKAKVVPVWQKVWPWLKKTVGPWWAKAIAFIRGKLPQDLSVQLSDRFLNILLVTSVYLVWSFFSGLTHPSQAKQPDSDLSFPEVKNKPSMTAPERPKPQPPAATVPKTLPAQPKPVPKIEPTPAPKTAPPSSTQATPRSTTQPATPKAIAPVPAAPTPKVNPPKPITEKPAPVQPTETVQNPEASSSPQPVGEDEPVITKTPTPKPDPIQPKVSPEKPIEPKPPVTPVPPVKPIEKGPDLAALKDDLIDSVDRLVDDATAMIGKVSVTEQQVKVELGDRWYQLTADEQSKLTNTLLSKSKKLDYEKLDIRDAKGIQVARSPYIGKDMVILKRSTPKLQPAPSSINTGAKRSDTPPSKSVANSRSDKT